MRLHSIYIGIGFCLTGFSGAVVLAATPAEDEALAQVYGGAEFMSLATGSRQAIERAPAVATVVTAADIEASGVTTLNQALATVPGLYASVSHITYNPMFVIRGIRSQYNPQILMMINGIPVTDHYAGDRGYGVGDMPVANIERIEVIRGPGSALYGADAYSGVINVVTRNADNLRGATVGLRAGSFDTYDAWALHGGTSGGWKYATAIEYRTTQGQDRVLTADAQSYFDSLFATNVSLAPGRINTGRNALDARLDLANGDWRLRAGYQGRRDLGTGAGVAQALDPNGYLDVDRFTADLTYANPGFSRNWGLTTQVSYFDSRMQSYLTLFPAGAFGGAFPNGMIGNPGRSERTVRADISTLYSGWSNHQLRLGTGYQNIDLYRVSESKNFDATFAPLPGVVDASNDPSLVYILPHDRQVMYAYVQDAWAMARDWELTVGARYDHYSDFGGTFNPRLALVWQTSYRLTSKLLYGRAFRAPAFVELYAINNPVTLGNSNLKPETIDTVELAWVYKTSNTLTNGLNLYRFQTNDNIEFVADPAPAASVRAQNIDGQVGYGLEIESQWKPVSMFVLRGNYAYQMTESAKTGVETSDVPHHQMYVRGDWRFASNWNFNTQAKWISERRRASGDARPALDGYTLVDVTLRRERLAQHWGLALSVHNLLNADAREPSSAPGLIPNDLPLAGRSYFLELSYQY